MVGLQGERIAITGLTGQVGGPVAKALAQHNDVFGLARFSNPKAKAQLEESGVHCITADLGAGDFGQLPSDISVVLHFAVAKTADWDADQRTNVEGTGMLLSHCRKARAALHCSSTAVYEANGHHPFSEADPLGDNHRVPAMSAFMPTYSILKIAAEGVARYCSREFQLPVTIARLNVPYGHSGGWPMFHLEQVLNDDPIGVHSNAPSMFNPIHDDDILGMIPAMLDVASSPATIVNWAGVEATSIEEWCELFGEMAGKEALFTHSDAVLESVAVNTQRMVELVGPTTVGWEAGMRRMALQFHPELQS